MPRAADPTETSSRASSTPNVYTVPPGRPFLRALAHAILSGNLPAVGGPRPALIDLPAYTILLPTRRAARALQEAFLTEAGVKSMLLPQIRPIAESDEDESLIAAATTGISADLDIPPAVDKLERQLVLTRFVMAWSAATQQATEGTDADIETVASAGAGTPAQAAHLARELSALVDAVETENVPLSKLVDLVPDHLSSHWQQTLEFLKVVTAAWPAYLGDRGQLAPMDRRNRLILAEAARIRATPPRAPLIVAGVTGSIPATGELMRAVITHATGAIVLPALDLMLDDATFDKIGGEHPEHPQFGFHRLLHQLGIERSSVRELPGPALSPARRARNRLISEAMRPSGALDTWRRLPAELPPEAVAAALEGVSLIEAATAEDEAETVALILREAAETPGKTAALVSPDRLLARRVAIRLEAYGIRVDDSAGRPFAKTVPGTFLDLVANAAAYRVAPADLMALLKHPLTRLGLSAGIVRRQARALELVAFRAPYLGGGIADLPGVIDRAAHEIETGARRHGTLRRFNQEDWRGVRDLVARLVAAFEPLLALIRLPRDEAIPLHRLCEAHVAVAEALAKPEEAAAEAPSPIWHGEAGEAAARLFGALMSPASAAPPVTYADYPDFYRSLIATESVRSRVPVHPRLSIWGPLEARMQQTDVVVLGSLNEGTWPAAADPGAWLNRPMRVTLGLPAPESETGRAAHDVVTLLGADRVILTRANKVDGVPTVPSRWLLRLKALLGGLGTTDVLASDAPWLAWARNRDHIPARRTIAQPEPRPPLALRPRRMSLSDVETWVANPYAIYAKHVLRLEPLPALGVLPGASDKGQIIHEALSAFARKYPDKLPDDVAGAMLDAVLTAARDLGAAPRVRAFWLPRFKRFAAWFADTEPDRRDGVLRLLSEVDARDVLEVPAGPFILTGRADRIDVKKDGVVITDYKTGTPPSDAEVTSGQASQLPLEAAMATAGGFTGLEPSTVLGLRYIRASGGEPPGTERMVKFKDTDAAAVGAKARDGLLSLIRAFDDPETPYRAVRRRKFSYDYDEYAGLARVGEWSLTSEGEEGTS